MMIRCDSFKKCTVSLQSMSFKFGATLKLLKARTIGACEIGKNDTTERNENEIFEEWQIS